MNGSDDTEPRVALVVAHSEWVVATLRYYLSHQWGSVRRWTESPRVGEWSSVLSAWFPIQTNQHHIRHHTVTASLSLVSAKITRFFNRFTGLIRCILSRCQSEVLLRVGTNHKIMNYLLLSDSYWTWRWTDTRVCFLSQFHEGKFFGWKKESRT